MAPVVASNGNTVQMAGLEDSQVNAIMVQTRAKVGRLTNSLRNLKGQLTREANNCYKKIVHFKTLLSTNQLGTSVVKTEYTRSILVSLLLREYI